MSVTLLPVLRLFPSYWVPLFGLDMRAFACLIVSCFALSVCCPLEGEWIWGRVEVVGELLE